MISARSLPQAPDELLQRLDAILAPGGVPSARILGASFRVLSLDRGRSSLLHNDGDSVLLVLGGVSKLVAHLPPDREQILSFHFDGDVIFAPAGGSHILMIAAIEDSELLLLDTGELLASGEPRLPLLLCERAIRSLGRSREKAVALGRKTAPERVADFLLSMEARLGTTESEQAILVLPMSRRDIADSLGLTIETVSRQFGELRAAGVIATSGRSQVRILDRERLSALSARCRPHPREYLPDLS